MFNQARERLDSLLLVEALSEIHELYAKIWALITEFLVRLCLDIKRVRTNLLLFNSAMERIHHCICCQFHLNQIFQVSLRSFCCFFKSSLDLFELLLNILSRATIDITANKVRPCIVLFVDNVSNLIESVNRDFKNFLHLCVEFTFNVNEQEVWHCEAEDG